MAARASRPGALACSLATLAWCLAAIAGDTAAPAIEFGGLLFGDIYHIASHHSAEGDGAAGLVLRRGYLTANAGLGKHWRGRARVEVNQDGEFETYTFDTRLKDLYLARKLDRQELVLGLSPTLTYDLIETTWSARYLMRGADLCAIGPCTAAASSTPTRAAAATS